MMRSGKTIFSIAFLLITICPSVGHANPLVTLSPVSNDGPDGCEFWGDGLFLSIFEHGSLVLKKHYCSAYGMGDVRMVTDAIGHHYVFLEYSEGHGTDATTNYLKIYRFTDRLIEKENLTLLEPYGFVTYWTYHYVTHALRGGGLQIILTLERNETADPDTPFPPGTEVVTIDRQDGAPASIAYIPISLRRNASHIGPQVRLNLIGYGAPYGCQINDDAALLLTIAERGRMILQKSYCSSDGWGDARVMTDAIGHYYVLVHYDGDQTANDDPVYLKVYRFTDRLIEKESLEIDDFDEPSFTLTYNYNIQTPPGGGLKINFKLVLNGHPPLGIRLPPQMKIISVDTAK